MKKTLQNYILFIPLAIWIAVIPVIVKLKMLPNPLTDMSWYTALDVLSDFFLYYKSVFVTLTGIVMAVVLCMQLVSGKKKHSRNRSEAWIFLPILIYIVLAVLSSLFSKFGYFCIHGMPDQFETVWNLVAYVIAMIYCYYLIRYLESEKAVLMCIFIGAALVGIICVLQYFKLDLYRMIYSGDGYTFTFAEGTVYGPFYNTNYVGYYTLLFIPLFIMLCLCCKNRKIRVLSGILAAALLLAMIGADSITGEIALATVVGFSVIFLLLKNAMDKKWLWLPLVAILALGIIFCAMLGSRISGYIQASDTETTNLENIYTNDDNVEIDYRGSKLFIKMFADETGIAFDIKDQNQADIPCEYTYSDAGYGYYSITDERFGGMTVTPAIFVEEPVIYGFVVYIDDKDWRFTNQMTEDGAYYYFTDQQKLAKLTSDNVSEDFLPLVNKSALASGRGYIWNKSIALLKDYIFLGSGADTYALVFPNDDYVDKYNNGYDNMIITKPHNLYLQIAVQTGVVSLICFLIFYLWYFVSSLRIYFRQRLDSSLVITGFAIMLGTLGYMISGIANDSTITIAPLYWAMLGLGIGINHRIKIAQK